MCVVLAVLVMERSISQGGSWGCLPARAADTRWNLGAPPALLPLDWNPSALSTANIGTSSQWVRSSDDEKAW